jgi:hypothetical protein
MRLRLLCAVLLGTVLLSGGNAAYAGQVDDTRARVELTGHHIQDSGKQNQQHLGDLSQRSARQSELRGKTRQSSVADLVRDLVSDSASPKTKTEGLDSLAVEPWMPGRGSLGVKVELTW